MHTVFETQQYEFMRSWLCMVHTCMYTRDAIVGDVMYLQSLPNTACSLLKQAMHGAIQVAVAVMHAHANACP
jgi:hypothetical protein